MTRDEKRREKREREKIEKVYEEFAAHGYGMEQLPGDLRRWIDKGFLQSVDWSGPDNPNLPMDQVGPWQRLKWIIPHREIGSRERKEAIRQENEEYLNYLFSRNIYPTIMYPRAEGITAIGVRGSSGNKLTREQFFDQSGLYPGEGKDYTAGFDKRLSRIAGETTRNAAYLDLRTHLFDTINESYWDGIAGVISESVRDLLAGNDPRLRDKVQLEGTVYSPVEQGQLKGHLMVWPDELMPGPPGTQIAIPAGTGKKELLYRTPSVSGTPGDNYPYLSNLYPSGLGNFNNYGIRGSTYIQVKPVVTHNMANIDVQTLTNLYRYLLPEDLFKTMIVTDIYKRLDAIRSNKAVNYSQDLFSLNDEESFNKRMKNTLFEFIASGGQLSWSPQALEDYGKQRLISLMNQEEQLQIPMLEGMVRYEMKNAYTRSKYIGNITRRTGGAFLDVGAGGLFVDQDIWPEFASRHGGGDQDDAINVLLAYSQQVPGMFAITSRQPNAQGETWLTEGPGGLQALPLINTREELERRGLTPLQIDFENFRQLTQVGEKRYVVQEIANDLFPEGLTGPQKERWMINRLKEKQGFTGAYVNKLTAGTLVFGREPTEQYAPSEVLIDATIKNLAANLSGAEGWMNDFAENLRRNYALPSMAAERLDTRVKRALIMQPRGLHMMDRLQDFQISQIEQMQSELWKMGSIASPPKEVLDLVEGTRLGSNLRQVFYNALYARVGSGGKKEDEDYLNAEVAALGHLDTLSQADADQSILQAFARPITADMGISDFSLWGHNTPGGGMAARLFDVLRRAGVAVKPEMGNIPQVPSTTSATMMIMERSWLYRGGMENNLDESQLWRVSGKREAYSYVLDTLAPTMAGEQFTVEARNGKRVIVDQQGNVLGEVSGQHGDIYNDLVGGTFALVTNRSGNLIANIVNPIYNRENEENFMIDKTNKAGVVRKVYDKLKAKLAISRMPEFVSEFMQGKQNLQGLPRYVRDVVDFVSGGGLKYEGGFSEADYMASNNLAGFVDRMVAEDLHGGRASFDALTVPELRFNVQSYLRENYSGTPLQQDISQIDFVGQLHYSIGEDWLTDLHQVGKYYISGNEILSNEQMRRYYFPLMRDYEVVSERKSYVDLPSRSSQHKLQVNAIKERMNEILDIALTARGHGMSEAQTVPWRERLVETAVVSGIDIFKSGSVLRIPVATKGSLDNPEKRKRTHDLMSTKFFIEVNEAARTARSIEVPGAWGLTEFITPVSRKITIEEEREAYRNRRRIETRPDVIGDSNLIASLFGEEFDTSGLDPGLGNTRPFPDSYYARNMALFEKLVQNEALDMRALVEIGEPGRRLFNGLDNTFSGVIHSTYPDFYGPLNAKRERVLDELYKISLGHGTSYRDNASKLTYKLRDIAEERLFDRNNPLSAVASLAMGDPENAVLLAKRFTDEAGNIDYDKFEDHSRVIAELISYHNIGNETAESSLSVDELDSSEYTPNDMFQPDDDIPVSETFRRPLNRPLGMYFPYGNQARQGMRAQTTFDAILTGERTSTTRWREDYGGFFDTLLGLKENDIISFSSEKNGGYTMDVQLTRDPTVLNREQMLRNKSWQERWSSIEGWATSAIGRLFGRQSNPVNLQYRYLPGTLRDPGGNLIEEQAYLSGRLKASAPTGINWFNLHEWTARRIKASAPTSPPPEPLSPDDLGDWLEYIYSSQVSGEDIFEPQQRPAARREAYPLEAKFRDILGKNALLVAPTGFGKTQALMEGAQREWYESSFTRGMLSIIVAPTEELGKQLEQRFRERNREINEQLGIDAGLGNAFFLPGMPSLKDYASPEEKAEYESNLLAWQQKNEAFYESVGAHKTERSWRFNPEDIKNTTLIIGPEKLAAMKQGLSKLSKVVFNVAAAGRLSFFGVDEAHRMLETSRHSFRQMIEAINQLTITGASHPSRLAVSGTITQEEQDAISEYMDLSEREVIEQARSRSKRLEVYIADRNSFSSVITNILQREGRDPTLVFAASIDEGWNRQLNTGLVPALRKAGFNALQFHKDITRPVPEDEMETISGWLNPIHSTMGQSDVLVGTNAIGAGIHVKELKTVGTAGVYRVSEIMQQLGRLRPEGLNFIVADPDAYYRRAKKINEGLDALPNVIGGAYEHVFGMYQRGEYHTNWKIGQQQVQRDLEEYMEEHGSYRYLGTEALSIFQEAGLVEFEWSETKAYDNQGNVVADEPTLGFSLQQLSGRQLRNKIFSSEYKDPSRPSKTVDFAGRIRAIREQADEYAALGNLFRKTSTVSDPSLRGEYVYNVIMKGGYGQSAGWAARAPDLDSIYYKGRERLKMLFDDGTKDDISFFSTPDSTEAIEAEAAYTMLKYKLAGKRFYGTEHNSPAGRTESNGSLISSDDRSLPGVTVVREEGTGKTEVTNANSFRASASIADKINQSISSESFGSLQASKFISEFEKLTDAFYQGAKEVEAFNTELGKLVKDTIQPLTKQGVISLEDVRGLGLGILQRIAAEGNLGNQIGVSQWGQAYGSVVRELSQYQYVNPDLLVAQRDRGSSKIVKFQGQYLRSYANGETEPVGEMEASWEKLGNLGKVAKTLSMLGFMEYRWFNMAMEPQIQEAIKYAGKDYYLPAAYGVEDSGAGYQASPSGFASRYTIAQEHFGKGAYQEFGSVLETPYYLSRLDKTGSLARRVSGWSVAGATFAMGLSGAGAMTMMAQPQFSLLALGIGTTAAAGIGIGTEIMEYQNKITGTEDYTWSNVFKKILVGASAFSKYSSDVLDSPLGLFDSRTWVSFLTGWEPDTRTKKSYSTWLKEAVRGDFGNVVRDLENTGKVSDTEQYWIDLSTEIARNVPGSGEPSAYSPFMASMARHFGGVGYDRRSGRIDPSAVEDYSRQGFTRLSTKFFTRAGELGYSKEEYFQLYEQMGQQLGYIEGDKRWSQLSDFMGAASAEELEAKKRYASRVGMWSGQLTPYTGDYNAASNLAQKYGILTPFLGRTTQSVMDIYGQFGGTNYDAYVSMVSANAHTASFVTGVYSQTLMNMGLSPERTLAISQALQAKFSNWNATQLNLGAQILSGDRLASSFAYHYAPNILRGLGLGSTGFAPAVSQQIVPSYPIVQQAIAQQSGWPTQANLDAYMRWVGEQPVPEQQSGFPTQANIDAYMRWVNEEQAVRPAMSAQAISRSTFSSGYRPPQIRSVVLPQTQQARVSQGTPIPTRQTPEGIDLHFANPGVFGVLNDNLETKMPRPDIDSIPLYENISNIINGLPTQRTSIYRGQSAEQGRSTQGPTIQDRILSTVLTPSSNLLASSGGFLNQELLRGKTVSLYPSVNVGDYDKRSFKITRPFTAEDPLGLYTTTTPSLFDIEHPQFTQSIPYRTGSNVAALTSGFSQGTPGSYISAQGPSGIGSSYRNGAVSGSNLDANLWYDRFANPIYETDFMGFLRLGRANIGQLAAADKFRGLGLFGAKTDIAAFFDNRVTNQGLIDALATGGLREARLSAFNQLQDIQYQQYGMQAEQLAYQRQYTTQMRGYEDQQRALSYASQMADFGYSRTRMDLSNQYSIAQESISGRRLNLSDWYQTAQAGISAQRLALSERSFGLSERSYALGLQKAEAGWAYQQWGMEFNRSVDILQRGWTQEDWQYQDTTRNLQFGWNMEDINENIRYAHGRQRKQLIKQRERLGVQYGLESEQIDTQRDRQQQLWAKEDERYEKEKTHTEEMIKYEREGYELQRENLSIQKESQRLEREQFDLSETYRKESMALEREQYDLNKQQREEYYRLESENLERKITEYQQQWDLQERIIATQRESQDKQLEWQQRSLELQQKAYEIQQQLEIITTKTTQTYSDMANQADMFSKYGENFNLVMESLKGLMQESNIASSTNIFALTDFIKAINSLNPSVIDHLLNAAGY